MQSVCCGGQCAACCLCWDCSFSTDFQPGWGRTRRRLHLFAFTTGATSSGTSPVQSTMAWKTVCLGMTLALSGLTFIPPGVAGGMLLNQGVNGGANCVVCTFGLALLEQVSDIRNESEAKVLDQLCVSLPMPQLRATCQQFVNMAAPLLMQLLKEDPAPDTICHVLGFCNTDPHLPVCTSVPLPPRRQRRSASAVKSAEERVKRSRDIVAQQGNGQWRAGMDICDMQAFKEICQYIRNSFSHLIPVSDKDKDFFGTSPTLRGSAWRGKDCNDTDDAIHPGAVPINDDVTVDSNCNGIFGVNPHTGGSYERELCAGTAPRGVAVLGDSISAHFHLPQPWLDPTRISQEAFKHWQFIVENELDWPHLSSVTGLGFNHWQEVIQGPIDSIYLRLRHRNRCNHKDYQNIAINGARASTMAEHYLRSLSRNPLSDRPLVLFYAMLGMDVCNQHADDTLAYMTTPAEMRQAVLQTLSNLDLVLPANSTVFLMGLPDGRLLYQALKDRVHPVASHWKTFTYSNFYDFFNCLQVTACAGWMNTNATVRNLTAQRAKELSAVLKDVASQNQVFKHFNVFYMDYPLTKAAELWKSKGGQIWQLLDPVDGFHSNQYGQALLAEVIWEEAEKLVANVFGPANANNHKIAQLFGDQGAYF